MDSAPVIGIVGGTGDVGRAAAARLLAWGAGRVRVGSRRDGTVDARDPASLDRFCAGCTCVVNCAGPAVDILDAVARAAARAGAHYVDASGDDVLFGRITAAPGRAAVISAGMMPGLTGLLPRYLAAGFDRVTALTGYVGGRDRFTRTAAVDYVSAAGTGFGEPLAAWRNGSRAPRALTVRSGARVPFFTDPVTAQPYLSTETERLAARLGVTDADWYSVFDGTHVPAVLARTGGTDRAAWERAAGELCRAAELDLFGRSRYQTLVFGLDGTRDGGPAGRTLVLRASGASDLTGATAAVATFAVVRGDVPPGRHHAAEVLDPEWTVERLRAAGMAVEVVDAPVHAAEPVEEGAL
jgi:hypothetical protein